MKRIIASLLLAMVVLISGCEGSTGGYEFRTLDYGDFGAGSLIIPMDVQYQNMGMWKAYGLVYDLLSHGIPVSWAINPTKTFSGTDFTATAEDLRTGTSIGTHAYSGGPFIIDSAYAAQATTLIQAWWLKHGNQPNVHQATAPFTANVDMVLRSPPRIANEETNAKISIAYYNAAGIPDLNGNTWSTASPNILSQAAIASGALFTRGACSTRNFDVFVTPHNGGYSYSLTDPANLGTRTYAELDYFVQQGGGWVALCHSILSNENAIANLYKYSSPSVRALFRSSVNGGFLTYGGFTAIANKGGTWTVEMPELPLAQAVNTPAATQGLPGGSVQTWARTSVSYYSQTETVAHFDLAGVIYDWAINGVYHDGDGLGKLTYLGGHTFSTSLPYSSNSEAPYLRFFYNSLFFNGAAVAKLDLDVTPLDIPEGLTSTVTIELSNIGSSTATGVMDVSIDLAAGVTYVSTPVGPAPVVTGNPSIGTTLYWSSLGDIAGETTPIEVEVELTPAASGELNIAHLGATYGDVYAEGFTADLCRSVNVYPPPVPQVSKTPASLTVNTGQHVIWTITYSNSGSEPLFGTVVEDILPAGFVYSSASPIPSSVVPLLDGSTRIRWRPDPDTLPASSTPEAIILTAYAPGVEGNHTNNVTLSGQDEYGLSHSAADTADVTVTQPPIRLIKTVSPAGGVDVTTPGQVLTYTLRPDYYGIAFLENVMISDAVPAYSTYVPGSVNAGGSYGYTPLPGTDGLEAGLVANTITVTPNLTTAGGAVTVTMTLTNRTGSTLTNITPYLQERAFGATIPVPSPASVASLADGASTTFTYFPVTMGEIDERQFQGYAVATQTDPEDYTFPDAYSSTVLVLGFLNASPANDVVNWRLGSNTPCFAGETIISGFPDGVYGLRGAGTTEYFRYGVSTGMPIPRAPVPGPVKKGGALTVDPDTHTIYASQGDSTAFYRYDIATDSWTGLAPASDKFNEGGGIQYLEVSGSKYVYALLGNSKRFRRYDISALTWTNLADTPENVKRGGALTTDGTYLYALRGDGKKDFWRYNITTNTWTAMTSTPENVKWGGALTTVDGYIYAFRGDGKRDFWRYDIALNSWSVLAQAPSNVSDGGALTNDGTYIYALQGKTREFWRYDIANDSWSVLPQARFDGSVGQGGALVYDAGYEPRGYFTGMRPDGSLVTTGDTTTLTMILESTESVSNVVPSAVTITGVNGASATLVSGPDLVSADADIADLSDPVIYEWTYTMWAGADPGTVIFSASGSGDGPTAFPESIACAIIVTPELSYQVQVFDAASLPPTVDQITNFGMTTAPTVFSPGIESNRTNSLLNRPRLVLTKANSPGGVVWPGHVITYTLTVANEGSATASNVVVSDWIPAYTSYVPGSASPAPVSGPDPLVFNIGSLGPETSTTITFQVTANTGLATGTYQIANTFTATADEVTTPVASNTVNNDLQVTMSFEVIKLADVDVVSAAGDVIEYTVSVINTGSAALTGITISDSLVALTREDDDPGNNDAILDAGEIWIYTGTYTVQPSDLGNGLEIENTVTVNTNEFGPQTDTEGVHVSILDVAKVPDAPVVFAPCTVTYTYTVTNNGAVPLDSLTLVDDKAGPVTLPVTSLAPGASTTTTATFVVTQAMIDAGDPIVNTAVATGKTPATVETTATATVFITNEPYPLIAVEKTSAWTTGDGSSVGDVVTYTFTVSNEGNVTLDPVTLVDDKFGPIGLSSSSLAPGQTATGSYALTLTQALLNAGSHHNVATATGTPPTGPNVTDTDSLTVTFGQTPGISVEKTSAWTTGDGSSVGDVVTYTFTVRNTGNVALTNVTVNDDEFGAITLSSTSLAPDETATGTYELTLTQQLLDAGSHTNLATATGTPPTGPNVTDTDELTVTFAECVLVCGFVYESGTMQGLAGWEVIIEKQGSPWIYLGSAFTDENGKYCFPLCEDGVYRITEVVQPGWSPVSPLPNEYIVTVPGVASDPEDGPFFSFENQQSPEGPVLSPTVGWEGSRVDRVAVLVPWLSLALLCMIVGGIFIRRRHAANRS